MPHNGLPPALAAAIAAKSGKKKAGAFGKAAPPADLAGAAQAKLGAPKPGAKKKGNLPPWLAKK